MRAVADDVLDGGIVLVLADCLGRSELVDEGVELRELPDGDVEQLLFAGGGDSGLLIPGDVEGPA